MSGNRVEDLKTVMDELDGELSQRVHNKPMGVFHRQLAGKFAAVNEEDENWEQYELLLGIIRGDVEAKEELKTVRDKLDNAIADFKKENGGGFGNLEDESEILTAPKVRAAAINLFQAYSKLLKKRKEAAQEAESIAKRDPSFLQSLSSNLLGEGSTSEKQLEQIGPVPDKAEKKLRSKPYLKSVAFRM